VSQVISVKKVAQDKSDLIFEEADKKIKSTFQELLSKGLVSTLETPKSDGALYIFIRKEGNLNTSFELYIYPGGEVFSRKINGFYETFEPAYSFEEKTSALNGLLKELAIFMCEPYTEVLYRHRGNIVYRKILNSVIKEGKPVSKFGGILKLFSKTDVVNHAPFQN
jgi:hypothetical protein